MFSPLQLNPVGNEFAEAVSKQRETEVYERNGEKEEVQNEEEEKMGELERERGVEAEKKGLSHLR